MVKKLFYGFLNTFRKDPLERVLSIENAPVPVSMVNDFIYMYKIRLYAQIRRFIGNKIVSVQFAKFLTL